MKKIVLVLGFMIGFNSVKAQTWEEWFKQDDTQIEYLVQQIAALKAYGKIIVKGYAIVEDGLSLIGDIKNGDFNLHKEYFSSLFSIPAAIKNDYRAEQIILWYEAIREKSAAASSVLDLAHPAIPEADYIRTVFARILKEAVSIRNECRLLLSGGNYSLKDDERFQRLKELHEAMEECFVFTKHFSSAVNTLVVQRARQSKNYLLLEKLYGLD